MNRVTFSIETKKLVLFSIRHRYPTDLGNMLSSFMVTVSDVDVTGRQVTVRQM